MKASLLNRLDTLRERFEELSALLSDAEVIQEQSRFRAYSREYAELEPTVQCYGQWLKTSADLAEARSLLKDADPDIRAMAEDDAEACSGILADLEAQLNLLLLPKDPNDERNVFLKFAPALVVTRRPSSPVTCSACTRAMPSGRVGASRSCRKTPVSTVVSVR